MALGKISPGYIKTLDIEKQKELCKQLRRMIYHTVMENGGHLASNLGSVELTVAMHSVFDSPQDKFVFDVGHQAYTHKIITGRAGCFDSLRRENGISGFPKSLESPHDAFIGGHSSISISAALGLAKAMQLSNDNHSVVAVIGDGAFTGGEAYEGLNNAGKSDCNLIIVLNENQMSISKNTGGLALYLAQIRSSKKYYSTKKSVENILDKTPVIGKSVAGAMQGAKKMIKSALFNSNFFENLGFKYLGPIDGHNLEELTEALSVAKMMRRPCLVHIYTKKGKGFKAAEENPGEYHGIAPKDAPKCESKSFTDTFGETIAELSKNDSSICGITAAMKYGTGLQHFAKEFPERYFDVGIAEAHAVTFAAGLAAGGKTPVFAVYSSFLQRSYDQLIHDCSIEKRHVVLTVDRAGLVGEDGETHQGIFDVPMLTSIPNATIYSPSDNHELTLCLERAICCDDGLCAVRYARGCELYKSDIQMYSDYRYFNNNKQRLIITYGRITAYARQLQNEADILQLIKIYPISEEIIKIISSYKEVYIFEESSKNGGIGEKISSMLAVFGYTGRIKLTAVEGFVPQATFTRQLQLFGLDLMGMKNALGISGE